MTSQTIHFVLDSPFPNYTGGRETWLCNVATRLADAGHHVRIHTVHDNDLPQSFVLTHPNIELCRFRTLSSFRLTKMMLRSYLSCLEFFVFALAAFWSLKKKVHVGDAVIALGPIEDSLAVSWLCRIRSCLFVCSVRGFHAAVLTQRFPLLRPLWYAFESRALVRSDTIWCNGFDTADYVMSKGFQAVRMPNGVDIAHFSSDTVSFSPDFAEDRKLFANDNLVIVSTATLLPIKGIKELIGAGAIIKKKGLNNWNVVWVGKGDSKSYAAYAETCDVANNVKFIGERSDVAPYLKSADIVVCLSGGGGLSMALLEAMAAGKVIVAWDSPVYRQILKHNHSAFLVEEQNVAQLGLALERIILNFEDFIHFGAEAKKAIVQYDWKEVVCKVEYELQLGVRESGYDS